MVTSVNTNVNALAAVQALSDISRSLTDTQAHIQSGLKVNTASDNPAVFTIAQGIRANIGALSAVTDSLSTGTATLQGQTAGATSISTSLTTLLKTVTQSAGQTGDALAASQATITNALDNIDAFAAATTINGVNLLASAGSLSVLSNVNGSSTTVSTSVASTAAGLSLTALAATADGTSTGSASAITAVNAAIATIGRTLTALGAGTVQLQGLSDFTAKLSTSNQTSLGAIVDANLSEESARLSSLQTKQSLAIQSLSIANQGPGALLQLFR
jgi:flagellin